MKILIANPAGNITIFVLEPLDDPENTAAFARAVFSDSRLGAEQLGFVFPPGPDTALWRLEMAGGEFCGNAARCFGLYAARMQGLKGKTGVPVLMSGADKPVLVEVDVENSRAAAEMPEPVAMTALKFRGHSLPALIFEGITHIIALDLEPEHDVFYAIKAAAEKMHFDLLIPSPPAVGVMFYNTKTGFMRPAVYVRSIDTLVFETSCGSGSAALGAWLSREQQDGTAQYAITQPGGVIDTAVTKKAGEITRITIGGEVKLGAPEEFTWPPEN